MAQFLDGGFKNERGQTLVEAVVAFGVAAMILVALVAATTMALSRVQFANHQAQARAFTQEGLEWVRGERDKDWDVFYARTDVNPKSYCLNTLSWTTPTPCTTYGLGDNTFKRDAVLTSPTTPPSGLNCQQPNCVIVKVTVSWQESGQEHKSEQETYLTRWKQ